MTATTEITRNSSSAALGLVAIQSRLNQTLDASSSTGKKLTAWYGEHGIALKGQDGQLRSLYDVLTDVSKQWGNLTDDEKRYFAQTQAGTNRQKELLALMGNFDTAAKATATALDSAGSAAKENDSAMESLDGKIRLLKSTFEDFANNVITSQFLGSIIDAGTALLDFANGKVGTTITQMVLFGGAITGVVGIIGTFISAVAGAAQTFKALSAGKAAVSALANAKWTAIAIMAGLVAAAIIGIVEAIKKWQESELPENQLKSYKEHVDAANEYSEKIEEAEKRLEKLNAIPFMDRTDAQQAEIDKLEALIEEYRKLKAEAEGAAEIDLSNLIAGGVKLPHGATGIGASFIADYLRGSLTDVSDFSEQNQEIFAELDRLGAQTFLNTAEAVETYYAAMSKYYNLDENASYEDKVLALRELGIEMGEVSVGMLEGALAAKDLRSQLMETEVPSAKLLDTAQQFITSNKALYDGLKEAVAAGEQLTPQQLAFISNYEALVAETQRATSAFEKYSKAVELADEALQGMPEAAKNSQLGLERVAGALTNAGYSADEARAYLKAYAEQNNLSWTTEQIDAYINKLVELGAIKLEDKEVKIEADTTDVEGAAEEVAGILEGLEGQGFEVSSPEGLETLKGALTEVQDLIGAINKSPVKIDIETTDASKAISDLGKEIAGLSDESVSLGIDADGLASAQSVISTIQSMPQVRNVQLNAVDNASATITAIQSQIDSLKQGSPPYITVSNGASGTLGYIQSQINSLQSKTITITTIHRELHMTSGTVSGSATGTNWHRGGETLINDGAPVNGSRAELVVANGMGRIYDGGETTIQDIPQGAKIYTAAQTQEILKDQGLTVDEVADKPIPALADGNVSSIRAKYKDYRFDPAYSGVTTLSGGGEDLQKNFDEWLKEKKHWLELDLITEAQYYRDLEIMNEKYLKNLQDAKDEYWQHEEEIYDYQNKALENQIELEEKLSELAKAKEQRVLVYAGGRFQYMRNIEAIAAAQREVDELQGRYAGGTTNARGGLSLVGEQGAELRVLNQGDGIIPADATRNLMELSKFNVKDLMAGIGKAIVTNYSFDISRLELPNVANAGDFLDGLKNLAYQYSYARA